jgi:mevalonate kinase
MITGSAPGKVILFGEHAVVYGRTAIAVPVENVRANAEISPISKGKKGQIYIEAPQIDFSSWIHAAQDTHPLSVLIHLTLEFLGVKNFPPFKIQLDSSIPIAAGMGSSAAISIAIIRALSGQFEQEISPNQQSEIAFEVEKVHHGTPSGVDNTVVAHETPVIFTREKVPRPFRPGANIHLLIADTGIHSETSFAVGQVRESWESNKTYYEALFDQISEVSEFASRAIKSGQVSVLGSLMNQNQILLQALGVSSEPLNDLIEAARQAGAFGAKLSGAGLGGNMIALVNPNSMKDVANALRTAGATRVIETVVEK